MPNMMKTRSGFSGATSQSKRLRPEAVVFPQMPQLTNVARFPGLRSCQMYCSWATYQPPWVMESPRKSIFSPSLNGSVLDSSAKSGFAPSAKADAANDSAHATARNVFFMLLPPLLCMDKLSYKSG